MKRLVKLDEGWVELDIRTYRKAGRLVRRLMGGAPRGYSVLITRFASDGWSVGDPEYPVQSWRSNRSESGTLADVLAEVAEISSGQAGAIVAETMAEWKRRDPGAAV
jgi:hypothetical protein